MNVQLIRHATLVVDIAGRRLLVDPLLAAPYSYDPVPMTAPEIRNPAAPLPFDEAGLQTLLEEVDAVIVTHLHSDHWDAAAHRLLAKDKLIICQPVDAEAIRQLGFQHVQPIESSWVWQGITLHRTGGQHGTGEIGKKMGQVSGFVLEAGSERVYIAGDTIWCAEVEEALRTYRPQLIVVNGGAAQFLMGDPITMTTDDILQVARHAPEARVLVVHLDNYNHCHQSRAAVAAAMRNATLDTQVLIPADGEVIGMPA